MRTTRIVSVCLLTSFALTALSQSADSLVQEGRAFLIQKNLASANARFAAAVTASPNDQKANVLYAATRLLVLPDKSSVSNLLNRLNVTRTGRDIYHWTAQFQTDTNGRPVLPDDLNATEVVNLVRTDVLPEIAAALANLAKVTDTNFILQLSKTETTIDDVTLDYGDIQMLRALLHAFEYLGSTLNAYNFNVQWAKINTLMGNEELSIERLLTEYPQLLEFAAKENLGTARTAFQNAVDRYLAASGFIRSRPRAWHRMFDLDPDMVEGEQDFRETLVDLRDSLSQPKTLRNHPDITVNLARHFDGSASVRSQLPVYRENNFVAGTVPNSSFGGLFPGATAAQAENVWSHFFDFAPPANDDFANRTVIADAGPSVVVTGSIAGATGEFFERAHIPFGPWWASHSVWWSWTPINSGTVTINTDGSDFDPALAIYTGTNLMNLVLITNQTGFAGVLPAQVTFDASAGTTYQIAVDEFQGQSSRDGHNLGNVTLKILKTTPPIVTLASPTGSSILPAGSPITIAAEATAANGAIARVDFYYDSGGFESHPTLIGTDTSTPFSVIWSNPLAGFSFVVALATDNLGAKGFQGNQITITNPPAANDNFTNHTVLTGSPVTVQGANDTATLESGEPSHAGLPSGQSVWYEWTAPANGTYLVTLRGQPQMPHAILAVYTGSVLTNLSPVASASHDLYAKEGVRLVFEAVQGTKYQIAVDSTFGNLSSFTLNLAQVQTPTVSLTGPASGGVIVGATNLVMLQANAAAGAGNYVRKVDFYSGGLLLGTSTGEPFWLTLSDLTPRRYTNLVAVATDNQGLTSTSTVRSFTVTLPPAVHNFIISTNRIRPAVDSVMLSAFAFDSDGSISKVEFFQGTTLLGVGTVGPFGYSLMLSNLTTGVRSLTAVATDNDGVTAQSDPIILTVNSLPTVIITSPANNTGYSNAVPITITASAFDSDGQVGEVRFYSIAGEAERVLIGSTTNKPYSITWSNMTPGNYRLQADAIDDLGGVKSSPPVSVAVATALLPPANDDFANATPLAGSVIQVIGSNVNATPEASEPKILNNNVAKSVWWSWTAPEPGVASVRTDGSAFDTLLAVYTSDTLTSLALVKSDDDSGEGFQSLVSFEATAGVAYRITVDGVSNKSGRIVLSISLNTPPVVSIVNPLAGTRIEPGTNITVIAEAMDTNGVRQVDFYQGTTLLGTVTNAVDGHYTFTWNNVAAGDYILTAVATDVLGAKAASSPVAIKVALPPPEALRFVEITRGTDGVVQLKIKGTAGVRAVIESSGTLTNWTVFDSPFTINANGTNEITDPETTNLIQRFYRVRELAACSYSINPTSHSYEAGATNGSVNVITDGDCTWSAVSNDGWLTIMSATSGTGNGTVDYSVAANTGATSRTGTLAIAGQTFTVTQAGATTSLNQAPVSITGKSVAVTFVTPLQFVEMYNFVSASAFTTGGSDSGTYTYSASNSTANLVLNYAPFDGSQDTIVLTFTSATAGSFQGTDNHNNQLSGTFVVLAEACNYSISPGSRNHGAGAENGSVNVTAGSSCPWVAFSFESWIGISGNANGTGNGTVNYTVQANTSASQRAGAIMIAGQTFTVTQAAGSGGEGFAPESMVGRTIFGTVIIGSGVFAPSGSYQILVSSSGNTYGLLGTGPVKDSFGTYTYTKTEVNKASFNAVDSIVGLETSQEVIFTGPNTGTYVVTATAGGSQTGTFTLSPTAVSPGLAPPTINGRTIQATSPFGPITYSLGAGTTYTASDGSSGQYFYSPRANEAFLVLEVLAPQNRLGEVDLIFVTFTSASAGTFHFSNEMGTEFDGTFTIQ